MTHDTALFPAARPAARVYHLRKTPPPGAVYIGRPGNGVAGPWGNPVVIGRRCPVCSDVHTQIGPVLACYEAHLRERLLRSPEVARDFDKLLGRDLVCFCAGVRGLGPDDPPRCHGQVMLRVLAERAASSTPTPHTPEGHPCSTS